ncbi:MAG: carboxypeptidase regulatory-like domain-containing protein, partial [Bacteroidetes bacterium]|nr:carboxypeptidase regulatory-like domain-containing protein [Bacteroidota bacterium]
MKVLLQKLLLLFGGLVISTSLMAQKGSISGTVLDADGNALLDVKIQVEGPVKAFALTDAAGKYSVTNLMAGSYKLTFKYTSLSEKVVDVALAEGQSLTQNVTMSNDQAEDEVVVIGYGTTRTKDLTGSATVINEKNFLKG